MTRTLKPTLIPYPLVLTSARLELRSPDQKQAPEIHRAIKESFAALNPWLPWAKTLPTLHDTETINRESMAKFIEGTAYNFRIYVKEQCVFIGAVGLSLVDREVPSFETGYWLRSTYGRQGYMTEAVATVLEFARKQLHARRVQLRTDERNTPSWKLAERLGFCWEGTLCAAARDNAGKLFNMRVYGKTF